MIILGLVGLHSAISAWIQHTHQKKNYLELRPKLPNVFQRILVRLVRITMLLLRGMENPSEDLFQLGGDLGINDDQQRYSPIQNMVMTSTKLRNLERKHVKEYHIQYNSRRTGIS